MKLPEGVSHVRFPASLRWSTAMPRWTSTASPPTAPATSPCSLSSPASTMSPAPPRLPQPTESPPCASSRLSSMASPFRASFFGVFLRPLSAPPLRQRHWHGLYLPPALPYRHRRPRRQPGHNYSALTFGRWPISVSGGHICLQLANVGEQHASHWPGPNPPSRPPW